MDKQAESIADIDVDRHWCAKSEEFAGADGLVTLLKDGWRLQAVIKAQHRLGSTRNQTVYHIELERQGQIIQLRVISSPRVTRVLTSSDIPIQTAAGY